MPKTESVPEDPTCQPYSETPPTGRYRIKWKGKITEEMPFDKILKNVESGDIGMLAQIEATGVWITLREFIAGHERSERERIETTAREVAQRKRLAEQAATERSRKLQEDEAERGRQHAVAMETPTAQTQMSVQGGMVFCKHCGNQVLASAAICMKCGSPKASDLSGSLLPTASFKALLRAMTGGRMFRVLVAGVLVLLVCFVVVPLRPSLFGKSDEEARFKRMLREHESRVQVEEAGKRNGETTVTGSWPEQGGVNFTATFLNGRLQTAAINQEILGGESFQEKLASGSLLEGVAYAAVTVTLKMTEKEVTELQTWYLEPVTTGRLTEFDSRVAQSARFGPVECDSIWEFKAAPPPRLISKLMFRRR